MSDTFWGLLVLALAIAAAGIRLSVALHAIARGLDARNAMLAVLGRQRGIRATAIHGERQP